MYQVICVGAGPAGSLSAYLLAKAGVNVAIIEKKSFPRSKPCGGGLSKKAFKLIEGVVDLKKIKGQSISGSYLCYQNEHLCYVAENIESYSIKRNDFDNALLNAAKDKGCDVFLPEEVTEISESSSKVTVKLKNGEHIESEYLILAEGITGRLYKQIGYSGRREWTMALEVDVYSVKFPEVFNNNTLFDFGFFKKGYGWIFPKDDLINIGSYYYFLPRIDRAQIEALELFVRGFKWATEVKVGKVKAYPLPYKIDYTTFNTERTILVGDAAGAVENFFGEGLYYSFLTSKLASEVLLGCLDNGSIGIYTRKLKREILCQIKFSRATARLFYNNQHFGYFYMARKKLMNIFYFKLIHGEFTQKEVFFFTIASLPISFFCPNLEKKDFREIERTN